MNLVYLLHILINLFYQALLITWERARFKPPLILVVVFSFLMLFGLFLSFKPRLNRLNKKSVTVSIKEFKQIKDNLNFLVPSAKLDARH